MTVNDIPAELCLWIAKNRGSSEDLSEVVPRANWWVWLSHTITDETYANVLDHLRSASVDYGVYHEYCMLAAAVVLHKVGTVTDDRRVLLSNLIYGLVSEWNRFDDTYKRACQTKKPMAKVAKDLKGARMRRLAFIGHEELADNQDSLTVYLHRRLLDILRAGNAKTVETTD